MQPGANVSAVARRLGVDPSQSFTWRRIARQKAMSLRSKAEKGQQPASRRFGRVPVPASARSRLLTSGASSKPTRHDSMTGAS
nr:transposase [Rhizobium sullae]